MKGAQLRQDRIKAVPYTFTACQTQRTNGLLSMAATLRYTSWREIGRKQNSGRRRRHPARTGSLNGGNNTHGTSRAKCTCPSHDHNPHGAGVRGSRGRMGALNKTPGMLNGVPGFLFALVPSIKDSLIVRP